MSNIFEKSIAVQKSATTEMMVSKEAQQVQVAMIAAKRFPRDEVEAYNRVLRSCQRKSLAVQSMYEYPRGGQKVTGPSIRLAEALAQNWGNIEYGMTELEQKNGSSTMMAFAWDLETNTKRSIIFEVKHIRSKKGGNQELTDPRDIYELTANQGARRMRSCVLGVIPGDVVDAAVAECKKTMANDNTEPLIDRVRKMVGVFNKEFSVSKEMLEKYLGCNLEAFSENDIIKLIGVYKSLKDGMSKREDFFEISNNKEIAEPTKLDNKFKKKDEIKKDKETVKKDEPIKENDNYADTPFADPSDEVGKE